MARRNVLLGLVVVGIVVGFGFAANPALRGLGEIVAISVFPFTAVVTFALVLRARKGRLNLETRRRRTWLSLVIVVEAVVIAGTALGGVSYGYSHRSLFAILVGGVMLFSVAIILASGIVLWATRNRLPSE